MKSKTSSVKSSAAAGASMASKRKRVDKKCARCGHVMNALAWQKYCGDACRYSEQNENRKKIRRRVASQANR